jgi:hypothetical protein
MPSGYMRWQIAPIDSHKRPTQSYYIVITTNVSNSSQEMKRKQMTKKWTNEPMPQILGSYTLGLRNFTKIRTTTQ